MKAVQLVQWVHSCVAQEVWPLRRPLVLSVGWADRVSCLSASQEADTVVREPLALVQIDGVGEQHRLAAADTAVSWLGPELVGSFAVHSLEMPELHRCQAHTCRRLLRWPVV
jgi:hypothetical protein